MIEIKCLDCKNCTGDSCKVYGSDADKAVKSCADDSFRNYKARMTREEAIRILDQATSKEALAEIEYYNGFAAREAVKKAVDDACILAIEALQEPEIVHCKDCKYWMRTRIGEEELNQCGLAGYLIGGRGYCLYGKAGDE